jgi:hypothetical protein
MATAPTAAMAKDQARAQRHAQSMMEGENHDGVRLEIQDVLAEASYVIYVYNIIDMAHVVEAPPKWPRFRIPACAKGDLFAFTTLPAFTKERFWKASDPNEFYYKTMDGRKDATTLLNPEAYPGTSWEAQRANWDTQITAITGSNNNKNKFGSFWSLTEPNIEAPSRHIKGGTLRDEINLFKEYTLKTMNQLVKTAELLAAQHRMEEITPYMHFAMDYLGKQATWHMNSDHMVTCPTCGDTVKDGIAYHKNSFGDRCIVDYERCVKLGIIKAEAVEVDEEETPRAKRSGRRQAQ